MLSKSNLDIVKTLRQFKTAGLTVTFVVPTATGIEKSIMDATADVREFLVRHQLHDFSMQAQGPANKNVVQTTILAQGEVVKTITSLYRPISKSGDPRIWPHGLKKLAEPSDLLAILANQDGLVIINCSQSNLTELLNFSSKEFKYILAQFLVGKSDVALELLEKMKEIHQLGFVQTKRVGDTGVGYTLETLLGIAANSSKTPDFKGIEIKSKRQRSGTGNRSNLFSQVPNWKLSRLKSSKELLYERGQYKEAKNRIQLVHQLSVTKPNSYYLQLKVDWSKEQLQQLYMAKSPPITDVIWEFPLLKERLLSKHKETFWITAETQGKNGEVDESFYYKKIKHTGSVDQSAFPILLDLGVITVDYTIKALPSGEAKDQGYLFKINPNNLDLLFDQVTEYDLDY